MVFMVSNAIRSSLNVLLTGFLLILPSWNPTWVLLLSSLLALAILTIQACTPYLGRFWSGCAGKAKRGLEISGIEIIDLDLHICLHLEVVQTPVPSILETVCWTLIDWYLHCFTCAQRVPVEDNFLCGCRWVFFKVTFVDGTLAMGFHVISRLRDDTSLHYLTGQSPKVGWDRPKQYDDKINIEDLDESRFEIISLDNGQGRILSAVVNSVPLKRNIRLCIW